MAYGLRNNKRLKERIESKNNKQPIGAGVVLDTDHVIEQLNHVILLLRYSPVFRCLGGYASTGLPATSATI